MEKNICLVMIVKNEEELITRCLNSVCSIIDYWVIVDTGSDDKTKEIIKDFMDGKNIPGELYEREWVDFSYNRNESLELANGKCDYMLIMDADDFLEISDTSKFDNLASHSYKMSLLLDGMEYKRLQLLKSGYEWKYEGILHEYIKIPNIENYTEGIIEGSHIVANASYPNGHPNYLEDGKLLMKCLDDETISDDLKRRYMFYCGLSFMWGGDFNKAIEVFRKRSEIGGWPEEVYVSLWYLAKLKDKIDDDEDSVINSYLKAWEYRPGRHEAAYDLLKYIYPKKRWHLGFTIARSCISAKGLNDSLFVDKNIRDWGIYNIYAQYSFNCGFITEAMGATERLINSSSFSIIPEEEQRKIINNLEVYESSLIESYSNI
jgi:glycosyltransferase involved in cell wall biosynthesis